MEMKQIMTRLMNMLAISLCIALVSACSKDNNDIPDNPEPTISDIEEADVLPVKLVSQDFTRYIESVTWSSDSTEQTIVLREGIQDSMIPKPGTIMVIDECEMFPFGFGATVLSMDRNPNVILYCCNPDLSQFADEFDLSLDDNSLEAELVDVLNAKGEPIDYEIMNSSDEPASRASVNLGIYNKIISLPFDIHVSNGSKWDNLNFSGMLCFGFKHLGIRLRKTLGSKMTCKIDIHPFLGFSASTKVECKASLKKNVCIGQIRFVIRGTIGVIPVIIPVTFYAYIITEASGTISCKLELSSECDPSLTLSNESGKWTHQEHPQSKKNENPWSVSSLDLSGSISGGLQGGVRIGLYSSTVGIGVNITPKYTLSANASLGSTELYYINPYVENKAQVESEFYCAAKLFNANFGKYSNSFPPITIFNESLHLLPGISNFRVRSNDGHSATVDYDREKRFFLEGIDAEEGVALFNDFNELIGSYQTNTLVETEEFLSKQHRFTGLSPKSIYFAAPYYTIFGKTFYGEQKNFRTDDKIETRNYKLTILSSEEPKLSPPDKTFYLEVNVDSENRIVSLSMQGAKSESDRMCGKYWTFLNESHSDQSYIYFKQENLGVTISAAPAYGICHNEAHKHNNVEQDDIIVEIGYGYHDYYVNKHDYENGAFDKYYKVWKSYYMEFALPLNGGKVNPCYGWHNRGSLNTLYPTIYNAAAQLERID